MKQSKFRKKKPRTIYNSFWRLVGLTTNCGLSAFYSGYCITYFNAISFRDIQRIYSIQNFHKGTTQGVLTGIINFTGAIGSIITVLFIDKFSRRKCLGFISFLSIILCLLVMIPNIWVLAFVRLVQGLQIGSIGCITPMYINEMMPRSVSAPFWSYHQCLFVLGISASFILTAILNDYYTAQVYWRVVFGFPIITSIIQIVNFIFVYFNQSPKYLVAHNEQQRAKQTLRFLYKQKYVERVFHEIVEAVEYVQQSSSQQSEQDIGQQLNHPLTRSVQMPDPVQLPPIQKNQQNRKIGKIWRNVSLNQMLLHANLKKKSQHEHRPPNNKIAVIACFYLAFQQAFMGGPSVINYPGDLIQGIFPKLQKVFPIIINLTGIIGALLSICILAKFGRKSIIVNSTLVSGICLFLAFMLCFGVDYDNPYNASYSLRFTLGITYILIRFVLSASFSPIVDLYSNQIVQSDGISSLCSLCQWFSMGFVSVLFPMMCGYADGNPVYAFGLFSFITITSYFVNRLIILQTKNKTEVQVRKQYDEKFPE